MLEEAVRWVIIIIIFVFDPLAVLLLIAAQYTFEFRKKELEDDAGERLRLERAEYERARAQAIVDNPVFNIDTPAPPAEEKEEVNDVIDRLNDEQSDRAEEGNTETGDNTNGDGDNTNGDSSRGDRESVEKTDGEYDVGANDIGRDDSDRVDGDTSRTRQQNLDIPDTKNRMFYPEELEESKKKVELELLEELNPNIRYYEDREKDDAWVTDRAIWETNNPDEDREAWRHAFEIGEIDSLPWETTDTADNYNTQEGYQQNAEQSASTLFNKLSKK